MTPRTALILGAAGQDGRLLSARCTSAGYRWLGIGRNTIASEGISWTAGVDITDPEAILALVSQIQPDEVYHLAAFHSGAEGEPPPPLKMFEESFRINTASLINVLDAVRQSSRKSRVFYAASSHVFGVPASEPQDERTPIEPRSTYGITKAAGLSICDLYRREHGIFASAGILYNHESVLRGARYLSSKVIDGALDIAAGLSERLVLGDLSARVDWGYAPEYVEAMVGILQADAPDTFVVATGRGATVQDFVQLVFDALDLDWRRYVSENAGLLTRRTTSLIGNPARLHKTIGWEARVRLPEMARLLLEGRRRQRKDSSAATPVKGGS